MSAIDALLGRLFVDGEEVELTGGINFVGAATSTLRDENDAPIATTIEVTAALSGDVDDLSAQIAALSASTIAYGPGVAGDFASPPVVIAQALDVLAAFVGPTLTIKGTFTNNASATAVPLVTVSLAANTAYRVEWTVIARNTTTGLYKKTSRQEWYNLSGTATALGAEYDAASQDNTGLAVTGASMAGSTSNLQGKYGGAVGHTSGWFKMTLEAVFMPAAT